MNRLRQRAPTGDHDQVETLIQAMWDVVQRLESSAPRGASHHHQKLTRDNEQLRETLREAAEVLHRTKSAFRSNQLKALRERIEAVLAEQT